uniref:Uncharacterized protein n=1 Tax=Arundo donax TaxID=35708 RepID=A0A0A9F3N4_ARUDO
MDNKQLHCFLHKECTMYILPALKQHTL